MMDNVHLGERFSLFQKGAHTILQKLHIRERSGLLQGWGTIDPMLATGTMLNAAYFFLVKTAN